MKVSTTNWGDYTFVNINSKNIEECMDYYFSKGGDGIFINPFTGYKKADLSFLLKNKKVKRIVVTYADKIDISHLAALEGVEYLGVFDSKQKFDFGVFPNLLNLRLSWHKGSILPKNSTTLQQLFLRGYSPPEKSLEFLPNYKNLTTLELALGNLLTLKGIEKYSKLKELEVVRMLKLKNISSVQSLPKLESLHFELCKSINDVEAGIIGLSNLETLKYIDNGHISSLKFLRNFKKLKTILLGDTVVTDGDLSLLLKMKVAGFHNKKHYSHTTAQVDAEINGK
ncbi:hypothetical protein [Leptospira koniambonensis]|uniref:hypothetical protein n=1 Tax=Leptospira koniambonensis TaxID=2484950 RepID=UPI003EBDFDE1